MKVYDEKYATVSVELNTAAAFLHVEWHEGVPFTKSAYKECVEIFAGILQGIKDAGYDEVFSLIPKAEIKIVKWQRMFKLLPLIETQDHIIFRRKIYG